MIKFSTAILKFGDQGEKTGWTYIEISADIAGKLKPDNKKSFRVKGFLDDYFFKQKALMPMGDGNFIMALKAEVLKAIKKRKGAMLCVKMEADDSKVLMDADLIKCLKEEKDAHKFFNSLSPGHQKYFSNWIESAKTDATKTARIAHTVTAMVIKEDYGSMIRRIKRERRDLIG